MNSGFNIETPQSDEWCTPPWLFQALDAEFSFTMDGAATRENSKCKELCDATMNTALAWRDHRVFCNPPYSNIEHFISCAGEAKLAVFLLPVRTDSDWFHSLVSRRLTLRFFRKRIDFWLNGKPMGSPRFASMLAILDNR
jgi:phage N-6-adenine-methyltransferase